MPGTPLHLADVDIGDSLHATAYRRRRDGSLQFDGERPGPCWRAHGYFARDLVMVIAGAARLVRMYKPRWFDPLTGRTTHSRPPDELDRRRFCTLVVACELLDWLGAGIGVVRRQPFFGARAPSPRTLQRWLRGLQPCAPLIQSCLRRAVIERAEPVPLERLFPSGVPPPKRSGRRWANPDLVDGLHRGLALAAAGSHALTTPLAVLLAEARQRFEDTRQPARNEPTART